MNKNQFDGKLNQVKGDAKIFWAQLTNDPKLELEGNSDKIKGNIQEETGKAIAKYEKAKLAYETKTEEINNNIKAKWDKFTHEDVAEINGSFEAFANKIKDKYNKTQEEANAQVRDFMAKF